MAISKVLFQRESIAPAFTYVRDAATNMEKVQHQNVTGRVIESLWPMKIARRFSGIYQPTDSDLVCVPYGNISAASLCSFSDNALGRRDLSYFLSCVQAIFKKFQSAHYFFFNHCFQKGNLIQFSADVDTSEHLLTSDIDPQKASGTYRPTDSDLVCVPYGNISKASLFSFSDNALERREFSHFLSCVQAVFKKFQSAHYFFFNHCFQKGNLVQFAADVDSSEHLLTCDIDPQKAKECFLGRMRQLVSYDTSGKNYRIQIVNRVGDTEACREIQTPYKPEFLQSLGRWLLVKHNSDTEFNPSSGETLSRYYDADDLCFAQARNETSSHLKNPQQLYYVIYDLELGVEHCRYTVDGTIIPSKNSYSADELCGGVHLRNNRRDPGAHFDRKGVFMSDGFCLLFHPRESVIRAALISLEKKQEISLKPEIQRKICEFDAITHLDYQVNEGASPSLVIEGERKGEKTRIRMNL